MSTLAARTEISDAVVAALQAVEPALQVQTDVNLPFTPPANAPWGRVSFQEGADVQVSIGTPALFRKPLLAFVSVFSPIGGGEGIVIDLATAAENALRRLVVTDARWVNFQQGPEGLEEGYYRKQVVAVFSQTKRV